ncbi:MAG: hypothetical protein HND57_07325 [Planctomycetes bacterium]|nr:hypothetical protein [Planctomycetota bacterium]
MRDRNGLCHARFALLWGLLLSVLLVGVTGCATPPVENRGRTNQVPPDSRGPVSHGQLGSKELDNTTDVMLESIVSSLEDLERDEYGNTVVVVSDFVNRSYLPTYDMEIFLAQLRRKLNQSGASYQLVFVERPDRAEAVRDRVLEDGLKDDYDTPGMRPNYALTGEVYAIEEAGARYWEVFFKLLDLNPNARYRNEIRWENSAGYRFAR